MQTIIKKVFGRFFDKPRKFFSAVDKQGKFEIVEKPKKFFPVSEAEYLLEQRRKGCYGNGKCVKDF